MIYSILYAALAALALGILVFIHELGHYFVARREGMKIEAFSIGFGKPFLTWQREGVVWQLCWVPFGGYVKIAGMEKKGSLEPYQIEDGFYGKRPWARIKVALAGPLANIVLAFILFTLVWITGGREKMFSEYTHLIGWVEPGSDLYNKGIRPGDEISAFGDKTFSGFQQMTYSALLDAKPQQIKGEEINYFTNVRTPFSYEFDFGGALKGFDKVAASAQLLSSANYLIYSDQNPILEDSPMMGSGIQDGDKIIWVDGELIFSKRQLVSVINQPRVLLTVQRGDRLFITRIPRLQIADLRLNPLEKAELQDVEYALGMNMPLSQLYFIPYGLTGDCRVENTVSYIDEKALEQKLFQSVLPVEEPLLAGDHIVGVDGISVKTFADFFSTIQKKHVQMVVLRGESYSPISWKLADEEFMKGVSFKALTQLTSSIGIDQRLSEVENLVLLKPIEPKPRSAFPLTYSLKERFTQAVSSQKKQKNGVDTAQEALALKMLEENQRQVMLGIALQDRLVNYNPSPIHLIVAAFQETWQTLQALVTGYLSPKYMSGPVGIVQVIHHGWMHGVKEALFWIAVISINLGLVNLLPIPVLDGGHICFSLYEMITGKVIKAKTMERMLIPFIVLLVSFFIYLTYQDLLRLVARFF